METPKVLVIDDDPMTCSLLETILEMEDYETESVSNIGSEGIIPILERTRPHILILDFHLGSTETLKYLAEIRVDENWQELPVLMTSAIDRRQDSLKTGANDFLLKPFDWQEITQRINHMRDDFTIEEV